MTGSACAAWPCEDVAIQSLYHELAAPGLQYKKKLYRG